MQTSPHWASFSLFYSAVFTALCFSGPLVARTAVAVGFGSGLWHNALVLHLHQTIEGPLRYVQPERASMLHLYWMDWAEGSRAMLRELIVANIVSKSQTSVVVSILVFSTRWQFCFKYQQVPWPGNVTRALWIHGFGGVVRALHP